jgi:hypothetical protein
MRKSNFSIGGETCKFIFIFIVLGVPSSLPVSPSEDKHKKGMKKLNSKMLYKKNIAESSIRLGNSKNDFLSQSNVMFTWKTPRIAEHINLS